MSFPFQGYDWQKREFIGEGGFAVVYKVKNLKTGQYVAVKQMTMSNFQQQYQLSALKTQIKAMRQCNGQYTVALIDSDIGKTYAYLIIQLCDQNLKQLIQRRLMIQQIQAIAIVKDIVSAYQQILYKGYIHRDLKPRNILRKGKKFKITDFGFATRIRVDVAKLTEICGTPIYMPPQLLYGKQYTSKCDVWSLGLIFYQIIFGCSPWATRYIQTYKKDIVSREVQFPYDFKIGKNTKDFIQRCLQLQQADRISWKQIFQHPLIKLKDPGQPVKMHDIDIKNQKILARIQKSSNENFVNAKKLFASYHKQQTMDEKNFYKFLIQLDPQITTYESQEMFKFADMGADNQIHMDEFKKFFLQIDYRPSSDVASKLIDQIVVIAKFKHLNAKEFFHLFDKNNSQQIDYKQFIKYIRQIAPRFGQKEIQLIWKRFDSDKSGGITIKQFFSQIAFGMTEHQKVDFKYQQRAKRNLDCLRSVFKNRNITPQLLFQKKKQQKSNTMSLDQFGILVRQINYVISRDQIVQMFRLIDINNSDSIELQQLCKLFKK